MTFSVEGAGTLLATDNADTAYTAPFPSPERRTFDGRAVVYLRASAKGAVKVRASSPGLRAAELDLRAGSKR